jgi:D-beta-D-heptose 7-phosphate kinase/D-beta-D-heptose 1-phosphate adenosyltransferase
VNLERCRSLLQGFAGRRIAVIGDLMMDEYVWGRATRISPESPVMVVDVERETAVPGGAANVVNNLLALGASVEVVGVVGQDPAGERLREDLRTRGAGVDGILTDGSRRTTRKTRVVAHHQQVLRVDREDRLALSEAVADQMMEVFAGLLDSCEAVVVSDYNKGVIGPTTGGRIIGACRTRGAPALANPKPGNVRWLRGCHVIQLNQFEAETAAAQAGLDCGTVFHEEVEADPQERRRAGASLLQVLGTEALVVTRGARGMCLVEQSGAFAEVPPHAVEVYDVAGAGDTVISTLTLGLLAGATLLEAAELASRAAACVVRKVGVATTTPDEVLAEWETP